MIHSGEMLAEDRYGEGERGRARRREGKRLRNASFLLFDSCIILMHWGSLDYIDGNIPSNADSLFT